MVSYIVLQNFRNYSRKKAEFKLGVNVVIGGNGQGKTNLLEALFFLLRGKSMRTNDAREMIKKGEEGALVEGKIAIGREMEIRRTIEKEGTVRGNKLEGLGVVCFQPDDIWMVKGGPEARRRHLDEVVLELKGGYRETIREYQQVLKQRNEAIRAARKGIKSREHMRHWNPLLLRLGREIVEERKKVASKVEKEMAEIAGRWGTGAPNLKYYSTLGDEGQDEEKILEKIKGMEEAEIRRGATLLGPHRDELLFSLGGRSVRRVCSQGEQKMVVIMWRLAQGRALEETRGEEAVMLMDDCLSELDESNRDLVMKEMGNWKQVLVTTTDDQKAFAGLEKIFLSLEST